MTTFNTEMTLEEATKIYSCKNGMNFPDTKHNREMIKKVITQHLKSLKNDK